LNPWLKPKKASSKNVELSDSAPRIAQEHFSLSENLMSAIQQVHWGRIVVAGFLSEVAVFAIFLLLLIAATLAGVPEVARPMSTLDYIDAILSSFAMVFLFTLWLGTRIESRFMLYGALVGVVGILLFAIMWVATTGSLAQPPAYVVAHLLKVLGGITGGLVAERRRRRVIRVEGAQVGG
jgi:hypothetical protein